MAERVDEASLPVNAPWRLMVADLVDAAVRAGCHGTFDESVRVVCEDLDSHSSVAPRARLYHSTAAGASWTASMSEICRFGVIPADSLDQPEFQTVASSSTEPVVKTAG